jgi:hypothetical protein
MPSRIDARNREIDQAKIAFNLTKAGYSGEEVAQRSRIINEYNLMEGKIRGAFPEKQRGTFPKKLNLPIDTIRNG